MNAIRKATEHKRKPFRPRLSEAGRRVLDLLAIHGPRYRTDLCVPSATIQALHNRGLVYVTVVSGTSEECQLVGITDLGRSVLLGAK